MCQEIVFGYFFQPFKNVKLILSLVAYKTGGGGIWPRAVLANPL